MAAANMRQSIAFGSKTDALLSIGGGSGLSTPTDVAQKQYDVLQQIAQNTSALVAKDTAPRLR